MDGQIQSYYKKTTNFDFKGENTKIVDNLTIPCRACVRYDVAMRDNELPFIYKKQNLKTLRIHEDIAKKPLILRFNREVLKNSGFFRFSHWFCMILM